MDGWTHDAHTMALALLIQSSRAKNCIFLINIWKAKEEITFLQFFYNFSLDGFKTLAGKAWG